jgi:hypothetical protein
MVLNRDDPRFTDLDLEEANTRVHETGGRTPYQDKV